jgi:hypothetical protein
MMWQTPTVVDYGSIGQHTFAAPAVPPKDTQMCTKDKHGDESCPTP